MAEGVIKEKNSIPNWVGKHVINCRGVTPWTDYQYITLCQIDNALVEAMLDTGGHASVIDKQTATEMGLNIIPSQFGNFGSYHSPGYGPKAYAGLVYGPVPIRFSVSVVLLVPYIRVIESSVRLVILGADLLSGGRSTNRWNFAGIHVKTDDEGKVKGCISFKRGKKEQRVDLLNTPSVQGQGATPGQTPTPSSGSTPTPPPSPTVSEHQVSFGPTTTKEYQPDPLYDYRGETPATKADMKRLVNILQDMHAK